MALISGFSSLIVLKFKIENKTTGSSKKTEEKDNKDKNKLKIKGIASFKGKISVITEYLSQFNFNSFLPILPTIKT